MGLRLAFLRVDDCLFVFPRLVERTTDFWIVTLASWMVLVRGLVMTLVIEWSHWLLLTDIVSRDLLFAGKVLALLGLSSTLLALFLFNVRNHDLCL